MVQPCFHHLLVLCQPVGQNYILEDTLGTEAPRSVSFCPPNPWVVALEKGIHFRGGGVNLPGTAWVHFCEEARAARLLGLGSLVLPLLLCSHFSPFLRPLVALPLTLPASGVGKFLVMSACA